MKKSAVILSVLIICLSIVFPCRAFAQNQVAVIPPQSHQLDNGMTVLLQEMPNNPTVALYALVKAGSATEGEFLGSGLSHFLEHMLFKGTKNRKVGQIAQEVKSLGGFINASTGFDYTVYLIEVPGAQFDKALNILADMLMNPLFDKDEIESERKVVFGEMKMHNDNPSRKLSEVIFRNVYVRHPYRHPVIGYKELFEKVSREDFIKYYQTHYIPNNIVFSVAGGMNAEDSLKKIEKEFAEFQPKSYVTRSLVPEPEQITPRRAEIFYPTELARMSMVYQSVSILNRDLFPLDVLAMILGQGGSSRLHKEIFEKQQLVRSISASNFTPIDKGGFEIEVSVDDDKIEETIKAVKEQIAVIQEKEVSKTELEIAKRKVLSSEIFSRQSAGDVAYQMAVDEAMTGDFQFSKKYVDGVKNVTAADVKRVARQYLKDQHLTIALLRPESARQAQKETANNPDTGNVKKIILDNGITVLLRENHAFPVVSINLVMNGGMREEPPELNGISNMTARLWGRATKSKKFEVLNQMIEATGGSLDVFSGNNSIGISGNFLSEDLEKGLSLTEDILKNPAFDPKDLEIVKESMRAGIISRNDNLFSRTAQALREILFPRHPYRMESLGSLETVDKIQRDDITRFYSRLAVANNMVLSVFGDFNEEQLMASIKKKFAGLPAQKLELFKAAVEPLKEAQNVTQHFKKEQAIVMIGFVAPEIFHPDKYGIEVISTILGASLSGRMFTKIRDELGQAYTLGSGYSPGLDTGFIYFYVNTTDENVDKVKEVVLSQIRDLRENEVDENELKEAQVYINGNYNMSLQTDSALNNVCSFDELYGLGWDQYKKYNEKINAVTGKDVKRIAREYLSPEKAAVVISRPGDPGQDKNSL